MRAAKGRGGAKASAKELIVKEGDLRLKENASRRRGEVIAVIQNSIDHVGGKGCEGLFEGKDDRRLRQDEMNGSNEGYTLILTAREGAIHHPGAAGVIAFHGFFGSGGAGNVAVS